MALDVLAWLAEELGIPLLEETSGGVVRATRAPSVESAETLEGALAQLTGVPRDHPDTLALLEQARGGVGGQAELGAYNVLACPGSAGARLLCAPRQLARDAMVLQRATSADTATGVAHEIANSLSAILGWAELGLADPSLTEPDLALQRIRTSARQAQETARYLLQVAHGPSVGGREPVDLAALAHMVTELLAPVADAAGVSLRCETAGAVHVRGAVAELHSVAWNLAQNAVEATPSGGAVVVRVLAAKRAAVLEVIDSGAGISEEVRERVFERYFTTKTKGTGLGLALVQQAVASLHGTIAIESEAGGGTRFVVRLPRTAAGQAARSIDPTHKSGVVPLGTEHEARLLIVEDDGPMRELMATTLRLSGAQVLTAETAGEALAMEGPFDAALVDLGLADQRGDQLVAELRRRGITRLAALVTGSPPPADLCQAGTPDTWIRKPFEVADLTDLVRQLLADRSPARSAGG